MILLMELFLVLKIITPAIFNLGNNQCENLMDMVAHIENALGKKAKIKFMNMQPEIKRTLRILIIQLNYKPNVSIKDGIPKFIKWYEAYHL